MLLPAIFDKVACALTAGCADAGCCRSDPESVWTVLAGAMSKPWPLLSSLVGGALRHVQATGSSEAVSCITGGKAARPALAASDCSGLHINSLYLWFPELEREL